MTHASGRLRIACPHCRVRFEVVGEDPFARIPCPDCGRDVIVPKPFAGLMLEEPVAAGPACVVYRALDLTLEREVAVRAVRSEALVHPGMAEGFLAEARRAAGVSHPAILPIYSCGEEEGSPFLVMQFMAGGSFKDWLAANAGRPATPELTVKAALAALTALDVAADRGIVHHHVRPSNLLLDMDGNVKVGDFGLGHCLTEPRSIAAEGVSTRDPDDFLYASPERLMTGAEDWRGDLFSLGAALYHIATGRPPLAGRSPEGSVEARIAGKDPAAPETWNPDIPDGLSAVLMRMMARDPDERFASFAEAAAAFRAVERDLAQDPAKTRAARPAVSGADRETRRRTLTVPAPERVARAREEGSGKPFLSLDRLLVACLLVLLILLGWYACRRLVPTSGPEGAPAAGAVSE